VPLDLQEGEFAVLQSPRVDNPEEDIEPDAFNVLSKRSEPGRLKTVSEPEDDDSLPL
jgi:hypothetical protein